MNAVIVTCSSLSIYVQAAQRSQGTAYPVLELDRLLHVEPERMKDAMLEAVAQLPDDVDTLLVAMGFCGGVWEHVRLNRRVVAPRVDDCVSLLLTRTHDYCPNRKEMGHLYLYEQHPEDFSALRLMSDYTRQDATFAALDKETLFHMWFDNYHALDIIDTGMNNCYEEAYVAAAQQNADMISATLDFVEGGNLLLEKLVSGRWDEQFIVAEPNHLLRHGDFFE